MPSAGQILFHKNFQFNDREKGKKLVIVLNNCDNDKTCLVLKTTSQPRRYPFAIPGCNSTNCIYFVLRECKQDFDDDTYIQLDYVYPIVVEEDLNKHEVTFSGHLSVACLNNLKKCLRNFREDIPSKYWQIIYSSK